MSELLKRDFVIRTISILFGILLWFFVLDSSANPFDTTYVNVPLKVLNEDSLESRGLALMDKNYQRSIVVVIKGRKKDISELNAGDFQAVLDFAKIKGAEDKEIQVEGPYFSIKGITISDVRPRTVKVELDKIVKNNFKVEVLTEGEMKAGYKIVKITASPDIWTLTGMESQVRTVSTVKAVVDVKNLDRDIPSLKKECKVYNKSGSEIPELSKNIQVDIKVEVAKEVPIIPVYKGTVSKDYYEGARSITPEKALIIGSPELLNGITELKTDLINLDNASTRVDVVRQIKLPEGIRLVDTPADARISVNVLPYALKEFVVSKESIALNNTVSEGSLKYDIRTSGLTVKLKGNQADLDQVDVNSLKFSVEVIRLEEGLYKLPLRMVSLSSKVSLAEEYTVEVKIEKSK